jgi:energy-coupling factor transporter ATP-binding protein EcfA2
MKLNRSQISVVLIALLTLLIAVVTNIATSQLPDNVRPYIWYAWPTLGILALLFLFISVYSNQPTPSAPAPEFSLKRYYDALKKRYQVLDLDALTPPQKEEYLQILLRSIFVEQNVRENPPPHELPKELVERLQSSKEIRPEDLPEGLKLEELQQSGQAYYEKGSEPVLDVIRNQTKNRIVILGDPGAGKSTLSRYLILSLIDQEGDKGIRKSFKDHTPILIELRSFAALRVEGKCDTFLEFLEFLGKTEGWYLTQSGLHALLADGLALVIFDGLDEIFDPGERERASNLIIGFAANYPKIKIVVTTRIIGYQRRILTNAGFEHYTLQDLDEVQVTKFVNQWYSLALANRQQEAEARSERILESFRQSASIRQLAGNPMLLTIMAIIGKHQELPRERWKLYEHAASVLIEHWDVKRHLESLNVDAPFIGEDDKKELLRRLAYRMQAGAAGLKGNYIHSDELESEFEQYLRERFTLLPDRAATIAKHMIEQFRERNFILSLYGANIYGFVHRAFLEYFCAASFVYRFEKSRELSPDELNSTVFGQHWQDEAWHEVLRLISGMVDERFAGDSIDYLIDASDEWFEKQTSKLPWNIALAVQCFAEVRNSNLIVDSSTRLLRATVRLFSRSIEVTSPGEFNTVDFIDAQILPSIMVVGANWPNRHLLSELLLDERSFMKGGYAWRLIDQFAKFVGALGDERTKEAIKEYAKGPNITRRSLAPLTLARNWPDDAETKQLVHKALGDEDEDVRWAAIRALKLDFWEDQQTVELLKDRLVNDPNVSNRSASLTYLVNSLGQDPDVEALIKERATTDRDSGLRVSALSFLASFYQHTKQDGRLRDLLEAAASDKSQEVREFLEAFTRKTGRTAETSNHMSSYKLT